MKRREAIELGLKTYTTGKPCKHGHLCARHTDSGKCVECQKIVSLKYRTTHSEFVKQSNRQWRLDNPDYPKLWRQQNPEYDKEWRLVHLAERARYRKSYRDNNRDKVALSIKQYRARHRSRLNKKAREYYKHNKQKHTKWVISWKQRNPDKVAAISRFRRTRLEQSVPEWYETEQIKVLYEKRDELNLLWGIRLEVDHIIPINPKDNSVCGLHCWANLQLMDKTLNCSKKDSYQTDW